MGFYSLSFLLSIWSRELAQMFGFTATPVSNEASQRSSEQPLKEDEKE